jgi:hypothetical protein
MNEELREARKPYQSACSRIWNAAQRYRIPLHISLGFFTAMDFQEIAEGRISDEALDNVMRTIAEADWLRDEIQKETRDGV